MQNNPPLDGILIRSGKKMLPVLKIIGPPFFLGLALFIALFWTGLGNMLGNELMEMTGPVQALLILFAVCFIPAASPILGPGLLIAVGAAVFTGERIAAGEAAPFLALAALFAIDVQIGGNFIPPGLVLKENEPETINAGVPGIVFTRLITIPLAVALAGIISLFH